MLDKLKESKRPIFLGGSLLKGKTSKNLIKKICEKYKIPFVFTQSIPDTYPCSHNLSIGSVGTMACSRAGNFALQNSDCCIALGSRLCSITIGSEFCDFARSAFKTAVHTDLDELKKSNIADLVIEARVEDFLTSLELYLDEEILPDWEDWGQKCIEWKSKFALKTENFIAANPIDLYHLAESLEKIIDHESTVVTDSGLVELIIPTNTRFPEGSRCIHPVSQGCMGFALPAAIGAELALGSEKTLAIIGDGSIMMNLQELQTISHLNIPLKIIIINNNAYSVIRRRQKNLFRKRTIGTDKSNGLSCPNFHKISDTFKIPYFSIKTLEELKQKLHNIMSYSQVICEIYCNPDQNYIEASTIRSTKDGKIKTRPLEDQYPFLERSKFLEEMIVPAIKQ